MIYSSPDDARGHEGHEQTKRRRSVRLAPRAGFNVFGSWMLAGCGGGGVRRRRWRRWARRGGYRSVYKDMRTVEHVPSSTCHACIAI